jgi:hypothetical protein
MRRVKVMRDEYLINQAKKLVEQQRPLPMDTVMKLNLLERQLKLPSIEFDSLFRLAIKDMNITSMWR